MINIYEQVDRNKRKSFLIVVFFIFFVFWAIYFLGLAFGYDKSVILPLSVILSFIFSFFSYWNSDKIVLTVSQARPATKEEDKLFRQVAENLSLAAQIPIPKLYVIEDNTPNAFATGRDKKHAVICVTTGLLEKLNRSELEAVIGHEISHIVNFDTTLMTIVSVFVGIIVLLSDWLLRSTRWRKSSDEKNSQDYLFLIGIILAIFSPIIAQLIQLAISRRREFLADAGSAFLTRQPSSLISALKKISEDQGALKVANKATAHLFIVNPFFSEKRKQNWFTSLFNTHPPVEERIKALEEML